MKERTKSVVAASVMGIIVVTVLLWVTTSLFGYGPFVFTREQAVRDRLVSGEMDNTIRQMCAERLNSYGLGEVTEGQINLCADSAKGYAYLMTK